MKKIIKKLFGKVESQPEPIKTRTIKPPVQLFERVKLLTNPFDKL